MTVCPANTIDSNVTGLAVAEEICPGVLPNMDDDGFLPTWYEQEPNTYPDSFGGALKTTARAPIKANRQRSKGTPVDLDATGGWNTDFTQNNLSRLLQGFLYANVREKVTTAPMNSAAAVLSAITGTNSIGGADLPRFRAGDIIVVGGSVSNDLLPVVVASSTETAIGTSGLVNETLPDAAFVTRVGTAFAAGAIAVTVAGALGTLHQASAPVAATAALTVATGNAAAADTVSIGDKVYTFVMGVPANPYEVQIGVDVTTSAVNLKNTINGLSTLTPVNADVSATNAAGVLTATAKLKGLSENAIATLADGDNLSWNHATLTGGTGTSLLALGIIPGEWFFLGGDTAGHHFVNNIGYARCGTITDTDLVMDRTTWDAEAEAAGALTIDIFLGSLTQNENDPELIIKRSYQLQRTLGKDADGTQSQYVLGAVPNQFDLTVPLSDKLTVDLAFIALGEEFRTGAQGLKAGMLMAALDEDAINSSNDIYEMAMTVVTPGNSNPTKLFGFLSDAKLTINNNVSAVKGIGKLGGIGVNTGIFEVSGTATAYFQSVAANIAITNSADVDQHFIVAKHNGGFVYDIGLLTLGGGNIKIESNKPITVPLTTDAAQNPNGSTLSITQFSYLPELAMPEPV